MLTGGEGLFGAASSTLSSAESRATRHQELEEKTMTTTRERRIPGPDHPITVEPTGARVVARIGEQIVADTTKALTLREANYPPVQYIPLEDVDQALLADSTSETYCPYKGDASYYSIAADSEHADAVWIYREPYEAVAEIAGHVAFYPNHVDVVVES
jgi:uncharacterized protein (DUF427 family)